MGIVKRSRNQRSFGRGEIGERYLGQVGSPEFDSGVRRLKNWDILEEGGVRMRSPMRPLIDARVTEAAFNPTADTSTTRNVQTVEFVGIEFQRFEVEGGVQDLAFIITKEGLDYNILDSDSIAVEGGIEPLGRDTVVPAPRRYHRYVLSVFELEVNTETILGEDSFGLRGGITLPELLVGLIGGTNLRRLQSPQDITPSSLKIEKVRSNRRVIFMRSSDGFQHPYLRLEIVGGQIALVPPYNGSPRSTGDSIGRLNRLPFSVTSLSFSGIEFAREHASRIVMEQYVPKFQQSLTSGTNPNNVRIPSSWNVTSIPEGSARFNTLFATQSIQRLIVKGTVTGTNVLAPLTIASPYKQTDGRTFVPLDSWQTFRWSDRGTREEPAGSEGVEQRPIDSASDIRAFLHRSENPDYWINGNANNPSWFTETPEEVNADTYYWEGNMPLWNKWGLSSQFNLKALFPVSAVATMSDELFQRVKFMDGLGGFIMLRMFEYSSNTAIRGYYDIVCWVTRLNVSYNRDNGNFVDQLGFRRVLISFPSFQTARTGDAIPASEPVLNPGGLMDIGGGQLWKSRASIQRPETFKDYSEYLAGSMGIPTDGDQYKPPLPGSAYTRWYANVGQRDMVIDQYALPTFYGDEWPRGAVRVGGSALYTGQKEQDDYAISSVRAPEKLMSLLPSQIERILPETIKSLLAGGSTTDTQRDNVPATNAHEDEVFFYLLQLFSGTGGDSFGIPKHGTLGLSENDAITWIEKFRNIVIGTKQKEVLARLTQDGNLDGSTVDNIQAFRGSTGVVATGDYSICFSGPTGKELYIMYYEHASQAGFRSEKATLHAPDYFDAGVAKIVWDNTRNAFWCLSKDGRVVLFFLSREYGVQGFSEYLFHEDYGFADDPIINIFEFRGQMCIGTAKQVYTFEPPEFEGVQKDTKTSVSGGNLVTETLDIEGEITFFKHAPDGSQGDSDTYIKAVGATDVMCLNTERLVVVRGDPEIEAEVEPNTDSGPGVETYNLSSYVTQSKIPTLAVKYKASESNRKKGIILNTTSMYSIGEE